MIYYKQKKFWLNRENMKDNIKIEETSGVLTPTDAEILKKCDHTLLKTSATESDILKIIDEGIKYGAASVCIPPCFVKKASDYSKGKIKICTVIGFPNGYSTTASKVFETADAVNNGADEIDMVINAGELKAENYGYVLDEIVSIKEACKGRVLKVIIETCLLTQAEKIKACELVSKAKADYIKTSTGFGSAGATIEDVKLMRKYCDKSVKIKAAGGIGSLAEAREFLLAGADRIGASRLIKEAEQKGI